MQKPLPHSSSSSSSSGTSAAALARFGAPVGLMLYLVHISLMMTLLAVGVLLSLWRYANLRRSLASAVIFFWRSASGMFRRYLSIAGSCNPQGSVVRTWVLLGPCASRQTPYMTRVWQLQCTDLSGQDMASDVPLCKQAAALRDRVVTPGRLKRREAPAFLAPALCCVSGMQAVQCGVLKV